MMFYTPSMRGPRQGISLPLYGIAKLLQPMPQGNLGEAEVQLHVPGALSLNTPRREGWAGPKVGLRF
jgi:hypothetical protein